MGKAFERLRRRWENNIEIGLREIGFDDGVDGRNF
jgi:hypothetical protein